jgi:hypothetical protein
MFFFFLRISSQQPKQPQMLSPVTAPPQLVPLEASLQHVLQQDPSYQTMLLR